MTPIKDKEASRAYQREWNRKNGRNKKAGQTGYIKRKSMVGAAKCKPCVCCNVEYPFEVMELHHVDPSTKVSGISELMQKGSYARLQEEIEKCVPLCANCHRMVHSGHIQLPNPD